MLGLIILNPMNIPKMIMRVALSFLTKNGGGSWEDNLVDQIVMGGRLEQEEDTSPSPKNVALRVAWQWAQDQPGCGKLRGVKL